jgi:hypothetical protein
MKNIIIVVLLFAVVFAGYVVQDQRKLIKEMHTTNSMLKSNFDMSQENYNRLNNAFDLSQRNYEGLKANGRTTDSLLHAAMDQLRICADKYLECNAYNHEIYNAIMSK